MSTIRVGILHSLTGTMALSESALVDATLMAIQEINDRGGVLGKSIEVAIEDGASDPVVFRQKAEKLLCQDRVATVFGCWTSLSRKAVKPVVEEHNGLLWYPVPYEGLEESPNIFYTGSCPNQQVTPTVDWLLTQKRTRFYLIGSDDGFARTVNKIAKGQLQEGGGVLVGESYAPLGQTDFHSLIQEIQNCQPDVVFAPFRKESSLAFYQQYQAAGISADDIPIMAIGMAEADLQALENLAVGHYAAWSYLQRIDTVRNQEFVRAFQQRYGSDRTIGESVEAAYTQVYLWRQAVSLAKSVAVDAVRTAAEGQTWEAPRGWVRLAANHHLWQECYIGKVLSTGQLEIVGGSDSLIKPLPWLGMEEVSSTPTDGAIDRLPDTFSSRETFASQSDAFLRENEEVADYIQQVQQMIDAVVALEEEGLETAKLKAIATRHDNLGQLAEVVIRLVETAKTRGRELVNTKEQLDAILNAVPGPISWIDAEGVYIGVNRHLADNFKLPQEAFIGKAVGFLDPGNKLAKFLSEFMNSAETSATIVLDLGVNDVKRYYLLATQKYQQGGATVSVGIDITERILAEAALQQSEARQRALLEAVPDLMVEVSTDGIYLDAIEAKDGKGLGMDREARIGKHVLEVLPTAIAQQYLQVVQQALQSKTPLALEYESQVDGEMQTFEARVTACRENSALFLVRNITDRKKAEAALVKSEERFRSLVANIPGAIYRCEFNGDRTMEYISDAIETISGYSASDFIQDRVRTYTSIIHPDDLPIIEIVVNHATMIHEPYVLDYRIFHRNGTIRWVYEQGQACFDADDNPICLDGAIFDITERKEAEEGLRIAEENYRSIFENALEGIFQSSPDGIYLNVNLAMARIYGYDSPEEMLTAIANISTQIYVDPRDREEFKRQMEENDRVKDFECQVYQKDGSIIWIQEDTRAVRNNAGDLLYYEGMIRDISDRKLREKELRRQLEELKIEIDEKKREKEVAMLTESSYFQEVQQEIATVDLDEFWS